MKYQAPSDMAAGSMFPNARAEVKEGRQLSKRAQERLRIAADLMCASRVQIDESQGFFTGVLEAIDRLPAMEKQRLRGHVDWVEDYNME